MLIRVIIVNILILLVLLILPLKAIEKLPGNKVETDVIEQNWELKDWKEGTRPYPKSLKKREKWYKEKWGENWYGPRVKRRIYTPGNWQWEVFTTVPEDIAVKIKGEKKGRKSWGDRWGVYLVIWAPMGDQVTDVYVLADYSLFHYDPMNKKSLLIGDPHNDGLRDGKEDYALLSPHNRAMTLDPVTGRIYFVQQVKKSRVWRYVEKLLPYECKPNGAVCYLPAVLDLNEMYSKVKGPFGEKLTPVVTKGERAAPVFVVRSNSSLKTLVIPGSKRGRRPLVTPDGTGVYFANKWAQYTYTNFDNMALFNVNTGGKINSISINDEIPRNNWNGERSWAPDGPGTHGGNNVGYEGLIYNSQHGGAGGGPGRMFAIDPSAGSLTMLYDSMAEDGSWKKRKSKVIDGPADAKTLDFRSTNWQTQCPRTGAVINGGWDNSGIRRYHDGFVTTMVGHNFGGFSKPPRPGWKSGFENVHRNSNPSVAPNGDLYIADVNSDEARIIRICRTDWPDEQPVNGYAAKHLTKEQILALRMDYARNYIEKYKANNKVLSKSDAE
jgi:hypothetical protein